MTEIEHEYTDEIVCPYCGNEYSDSWEYEEEGSKIECDSCNRKFNYTRNTSVSYTTSKLDCKEQEGKEHQYEYSHPHLTTTKFDYLADKLDDIPLEEKDWECYEVFICKECEDTKFIKISKEEFVSKYPEDYERWKNYHYKKFGGIEDVTN